MALFLAYRELRIDVKISVESLLDLDGISFPQRSARTSRKGIPYGMSESTSDDDMQNLTQHEELEDWDDWHEGLPRGTKSLFSAQSFPSAEAAIEFDAATFGFDLLEFQHQVNPGALGLLNTEIFADRADTCPVPAASPRSAGHGQVCKFRAAKA